MKTILLSLVTILAILGIAGHQNGGNYLTDTFFHVAIWLSVFLLLGIWIRNEINRCRLTAEINNSTNTSNHKVIEDNIYEPLNYSADSGQLIFDHNGNMATQIIQTNIKFTDL